MANIGGGRALRVCDLCGGVDDHPRHVLAGAAGGGGFPAPSQDVVNAVLDAAPQADRGRLLTELMDTATSDRHLDCCREAGCVSCGERTRGVEDKRGKALLAHLMKEA